MRAVIECPALIREICHTAILILSMSNWIAVIYSFLDRKKRLMMLNLTAFIVQFFVLQVFTAVAENNIDSDGSKSFLPLAELPLILYIAIALTCFSVGIISTFFFTNRKRRRITPEGIPKENLLLHERALKLETDTVRLAEMNNQMKIYGEEMQEQIKEREILQAKMNIHAGMNRLLLTSLKAVESNDREEIKDAVSMWRRDALLLCKESDRRPVADMIQDLNSLAKSLNIKFECSGASYINDEKTLIMFYKTACECMTNAVKHAGADRFIITATANDIIFSNNGKLPADSDIELGGGLRAVKALAEDNGYSISFRLAGKFSLILKKRGGKENAL